jgi:PAS domain S-box-containing protein
MVCSVSFFILLFFSFFYLSCGRTKDESPDEKFQYSSYKDVPGVTEEEIKAIEALAKRTVPFIYATEQSTVSFYDINGNIRGFSALFCEWLSSLFDIPFKPAIIEWNDLLAALASFDVDFTGVLTATEERQKIYFMTTDIAMNTVRCFRLADSIPLEVIAESRLPRYALIEGTVTIDQISSMLNGTFEIVPAQDVDTVHKMLHSGEADAYLDEEITEAFFDVYGDVVVSDFLPLTYSPVSLATQNPALRSVISVVQKALDAGALRHLVELSNTGYQEYRKSKLLMQLNEEEKAYIQNHTVVPFAAETGNYPVSFYNAREKKWEGIAFDVLSEVEALTGLHFVTVNGENSGWPVLLKMLEDGKASMITELMYTDERAGNFLWPDTAIMVSHPALISRMDQRNIGLNEILFAKVGLIKDYGHTALFHEWFPNHSANREYESSLDAFRALDRGEVDFVLTSSHELMIMTHYMEETGYKINYQFNNPFKSTFGFSKDNAVLCSIVDKALYLVNMETISNKWMHRTYDYRSKVIEAQRPWFIVSSLFFFAVLSLVVILFVRNRRIGKGLERLVGERTEELELKNVTLTTLFDSIPDLVFTLDTSLRFTQCNKSFLEHFGFNMEGIINKGEDSLGIPAREADKHNDWNRKVIEERQIFVIEERIPRVDGTNPLYETVKAPVILNGIVVGVLGIAHDITKRKEMEEAALAASRSKSVFLANMSHEIRTPMNSIVGFSELALDGETTPKTRDYIAKIKTNAEWLLQIINDILDISKIESGKMELEHIPFDMRELFSSCRTLIIPKAIEKGIQLHFYAEPSMGRKLLGDPTRLRQVLVNLLTNAVKFTNAGIVKLHAAITGKTGDSITMHFEVKDSGIGMSEEQIDKIFEPFVQAETGTTRKYGGTGLGLPITRNIIEMMGGKLCVESTPGLGSKFSFDLTFNTIDESFSDIVEQKIMFDDSEKPLFEGEVLLCEDNEMNQQVISEHLARVGLKTVVAENGRIGVDMVENRIKEGKKQFDLIFMDMHMPVMDGLEAAAKILELKAGVPIVAMTANVMSNDRNIYSESGMHDCVGKPFTSQELWRCLVKYLKPVNGGAVVLKNTNDRPESESDFIKSLEILFFKNNERKFEEIKEALEADDIKLAHRLVHSLKSNAAQIGRVSLQKAAADMEMRLKDGKNLADHRQMSYLKTELDLALSQLAPLLNDDNDQSGSEQSAPLEPHKALELLEELEVLLKSGNTECIKLTGALRAVEGSGLLIRQIENFDFDLARSTLAGLKKSWNKNGQKEGFYV